VLRNLMNESSTTAWSEVSNSKVPSRKGDDRGALAARTCCERNGEFVQAAVCLENLAACGGVEQDGWEEDVR
jgi:hypothetical protein